MKLTRGMTMTNNGKLTKEEKASLNDIAKDLRGLNSSISEDVKECREHFESRKQSRADSREKTLNGLEHSYRVFARGAQGKDQKHELLVALGDVRELKTSGMLLNGIIKATITRDTKYASKLASIIRHAIRERVPVTELSEFVMRFGSIRKCIEASVQKAQNTKPSKGARLVTDSKIANDIAKIRGSAKAAGKALFRNAKLKFNVSGQIECLGLWKGTA